MKHNPQITKKELVVLLNISDTGIDNNIKYLRNKSYIERIGVSKTGFGMS